MKTLAVKHRLAIVALGLGAVALFGPNPLTRSFAFVNLDELASRADKDVARVEPRQLADMLIEGRADYFLIDLRSAPAYEKFRLPGAMNVRLAELIRANHLKQEKLLIYGEDDLQAAQAWFLLSARGFRFVALVAGGVDGWKNEVLYPTLATDASLDERQAFEKAKVVSLRFGGAPRVAGAASELIQAQVAAPPPVVSPAPAGLTPGKPRKREGC